MPKPLVFISHITEEKPVATALKALIQEEFLDLFDVFVSSDGESIRAGAKWLDNISEGLNTCVIEFVVCSPQSIKRPWINFEAGAGWVRDIPVIPVCHSGMTPSQLPMPLNMLQAVNATEEAQLRLILPVIAGALKSRVPNVDFAPFVSAVKAFEEAYTFWDILRQHLTVVSTAAGRQENGLSSSLRGVLNGSKPFNDFEGSEPGMVLQIRGNISGDIAGAISYLESNQIFRIKVVNSGMLLSPSHNGPYSLVEIIPLARFQEIFSDSRILS